jgi:hypothetical protein
MKIKIIADTLSPVQSDKIKKNPPGRPFGSF